MTEQSHPLRISINASSKPSLSHSHSHLSFPNRFHSSHFRSHLLPSSSFSPFTLDSNSLNSRILRHGFVFSCTLQPDNLSSSSEFDFTNNNSSNLEFEESRVEEVSSERLNSEETVVVGDKELENLDENVESKAKLSIAVFFMALVARVKKGFQNFFLSDWFNWLPFWWQDKRLELLLAEADANPKDADKQSRLLAQLNKESPESVIRRFEQRDYNGDSESVIMEIRRGEIVLSSLLLPLNSTMVCLDSKL